MKTEPRSGFRHKQRIIYAVMYTTTTGSGLYVRLDEFGDHLDRNTFHADPKKHVVQARPSDTLVGKIGQCWASPSLRVVSWLPDVEAGAKPVTINFHNHTVEFWASVIRGLAVGASRTEMHSLVLQTIGVPALVLAASCALGAKLEAKITSISDCDTVVALDAIKYEFKIRLAFIDSLETGQDFGTRSKQPLGDKVFGKIVTIETNGQDKFGRTLGTLKVGRRNINQEMVAEG